MDETEAIGRVVNDGCDDVAALLEALVEGGGDEAEDELPGCRVDGADGAIVFERERSIRVAEGGYGRGGDHAAWALLVVIGEAEVIWLWRRFAYHRRLRAAFLVNAVAAGLGGTLERIKRGGGEKRGCRVDGFDDGSSVGNESPACVREANVAAGSVEELDADGFFQRLDLEGCGGLAHVEGARGLAEVEQNREGEETTQLPDPEVQWRLRTVGESYAWPCGGTVCDCG